MACAPSNVLGFSISPDIPDDRSNIFSMVWQVRAGHAAATDSIGDGVLHQILETALMLCVSWKPECSGDDGGDELMEDTDGDACETLDDEYIALKLSRFPSDEKLDALSALRHLSAIYMLKVGNGPDPVSPALLKCAVNTIDSIIDMPWLQHMFKTLALTLAMLPAEHGGPMPEQPGDRIKLVRIFQARMDSSSLSSHSKGIIKDIFNKRVTADALIPLLQFEGCGHPIDPSFAGLVDSDDTPDQHYRARRFVKVLSGVNLLPSTGCTFKINLVQTVPEAATFGQQYNVKSLNLHTSLLKLR
ncbi:uncharacterized protein EDB91DRAFT_1077951 [Suillus paluster]|uniref:uncharacterized protein n=1 Tax=Suillus paluster TaxID=48578 RepID=UPI001B87BFAD|nr:uncharacterized protein EDB91DRAFT_1077951 [Suillus paluster]KAG1752602.1 hypothetical protein EDB91DRAFT_1077951 [Suillus paluster]